MKPTALLIDYKVEFSTDVATLAIFDPSILAKYKNSDPDWWINFCEVDEVQRGEATFISVGEDGHYTVRLTSDGLNDNEKRHATQMIGDLGVEVSSGKIYFGDAGGCSYDDMNELAVEIPNGQYELTIYALNQNDEHTLADIVIIITPRSKNFTPYTVEPCLRWDSNTYLFAEKPKIRFGRTLKGKVWRTQRTESGLVIKSNVEWPQSHWRYDAILDDMSQVKAGDEVTFKTSGLDEDNKLLIGIFISRTPKVQE